MKKRAGNRKIRGLLIIIFWLACWQLLALYFNRSILFAGPAEVFKELKSSMFTTGFWKTVCGSFGNILAGFFSAFLTALLLGTAAAKCTVLEEFLTPLMQFIKAVPVASFVVLLLMWTGSERLSVAVTFLMVLPIIYQNVLGGIKHTDKELLEMAKVFEMPMLNRIQYIYMPSMYPFFKSGCKAALGMSWKAGIAAEVIGTPDFSIGERIYMSKIYLNTAGLFAWTFVVILLSFLFEKGVLFLLKKAEGMEKKTVRIRNGKKKESWQQKEREDIVLEKVCKVYGKQQVLNEYSLKLKAGGIYCIMGCSGGGKTTLFRILLGLEHYHRGSVQKPAARASVVFQEDRLCLKEDAATNVGMVCTTDVSEEEIKDALAQVLPAEELEKRTENFSGGMRRRTAIVRAVMADSQWIVMDEPFTGLDETTKEKLVRFILKYRNKRTLIIATHQEQDVGLLGAELIKLP